MKNFNRTQSLEEAIATANEIERKLKECDLKSKHEAIKTCVLLNYQWELFFGNGAKEEKPFKVYCVESEPMEITSD